MKTKVLKRERVYQELASIYDYPLTILTSPIGYGKTTAVRNFIEVEEVKSIWISMKNSGESPNTLWEEFAEEIGKLDEKCGKALKGLGFPKDVPQREKVFSVLDDMDYDMKTVVVLSDFHLVGNTQIEKLVAQLSEERVENLHLVLITTDTTTLGVGELMSKGICHVLPLEALKFTEEETRKYCHIMLSNISEESIDRVIRYADGWIALIYMLLLGLEKGIPVGMNMNIDGLIEQNLFSRYDEMTQNFLMKLALMDQFTAEQAAYVIRDKKTYELLRRLHMENSFVYFDEMKKTYKIHNVLLDFLRAKQSFEKKELKEAYHRLGQWHLEKGELIKAYGYFNKAGETKLILSILDNPENIRNELAEFEGSVEMFNRTPKRLLEKYPIAYLQYIMISIVRGDERLRIECLKMLGLLEDTYRDNDEIELSFRNRILAEILIIRKIAGFNHMDASTKNDEQILELLDGEQSYIFQQENEFTFGSPHLIYNYFREPGTLKEKTQTIIDRFILYPQYTNGCGTGADYLALAEYALETGNWQGAELNSFKAIYKAGTKNQHSLIICGNFTLIRLYIFQGKLNEAIEMLKQLEQEIGEVNNPILNTTVDICKGYIYGNLGQLEKIPYWLQVGDMSSADLLYQGVAFNYIAYGKAVLASKNYVKLEVLSESFVEYFSIFSNQLGFIHNGIFESIAKFQLFGMPAGVKSLKKVLSKGRADDIIMPFIENAPYLIEMLKNIGNSKSTNGYIKRVLLYCEQYLMNLKNVELLKITLTLREKEVLSLAAEGITREGIASRLMISQGTVKTHLQNIYQKLEASGKSAAVKTALKNGLI